MAERGGFINDTDRAALESFPASIDDAARSFTLLADDVELITKRYGPAARLAGGLQIGAIRLLGFVPADLSSAPASVVEFVADQLGVTPSSLGNYSNRGQTRSDHVADIERHLGFRRASQGDLKSLGDWLVERALEHDRPTVLFGLACEFLRSERLVRPGVTTLERAVIAARQRATNETYLRLLPQLDQHRRDQLTALLDVDSVLGVTSWVWLKRQAPTAAPASIKEQISKIQLLRDIGADELDLSVLNPNRVRHLAAVGNRMTAQAIGRLAPERRYQILAATVASALVDRTDEVLDLFDIAIAGIERSARTAHTNAKTAAADAAIDTVRVFNQIASIVVDPNISDIEVRSAILARVGPQRFHQTVEQAAGIDVAGDAYLALLSKRYNQLRKFAPTLLAAFDFHAPKPGDDLLAAVQILKGVNASGTRLVPPDTPTGFAPRRWQRHMVGHDRSIDRHAWETCVLVELRGALRGANLWVDHSRRYRNPSDYLIPNKRWAELRPEFTASTGIALDPTVRLDQLDQDINTHLDQLDTVLAGAETVRVDDGKLVVPNLPAEENPPGTEELRDLVDGLMPQIDLVDMLVEVDSWTGFRQPLTHADNATTRTANHPERLLAAIVAHGCNFGINTMARIAGFTPDELAWTNTWHLRTETVRAANDRIVNHQTALPIAANWGAGTLSSSDGQRFPVTVNTPRARHQRKYFTGTGATIYTWTSDRHAQYGTRIIPTTVREATYVLDAIFDNETDLQIEEHTTDTAGYTDLIYGLFDLTGLRFSPRIRDLADQRLWRLPTTPNGTTAADLLRHPIRTERIIERWDEMLRVAATIRHGYLPASTLVSRLQASARQNRLTQAIQEYGRIAKTISILRYLNSPEHRRRILVQLNKGESLHALRQALFFANRGMIRRHHTDDQDLQGECLTLLTNAVVCWNTVYTAAAIDHLRDEGRTITNDQIQHLAPTTHAHLNRYGRYDFHTPTTLTPGQLRPLRH